LVINPADSMDDIFLTFYLKKCSPEDLKGDEYCATDEEIDAYLETPFVELE
jgi:hypothetical protein